MKVKAILIGAIGVILLFGILLTSKLKVVLKPLASDEFYTVNVRWGCTGINTGTIKAV